jgi:hypothetical protein
MDSWEKPMVPEDMLNLSFLGLHMVFGDAVPREQLQQTAREIHERRDRYRTMWVAGQQVQNLSLSKAHLSRIRRAVAKGHGAFITAFQGGPFLQLPFLLASLDFEVMLLMDPENYEHGMACCKVDLDAPAGEQAKGFWPPDKPQGLPVHFVSSSDANTAWRLTKWLRDGKVAFAYMDGNRGLDEDRNPKTSTVASFFGIDIWVRKGLAYLAGFAGAPLFVMVCRPVDGGHKVYLSQQFARRAREKIEAFCDRAVRAAYTFLEQQLISDVPAWAEWQQLPRWAVHAKRIDTPTLSAEQALESRLQIEPRVVPIQLGEMQILVNQKNGTAVAATPVISDVLRVASTGATVEQILDRLSPSYGEETLLEIIHALATDAFLYVSPS